MIPFPHNRFPYSSGSTQYDDVPETCCSYCATYFPADDPDQTVCDECQRVCRMCGQKYASAFSDQHCCDRCSQLPEPTEPQPNNPMLPEIAPVDTRPLTSAMATLASLPVSHLEIAAMRRYTERLDGLINDLTAERDELRERLQNVEQ